MQTPTREQILAILEGVMDPEIPVLSVVDMGIIRDTRWDEDAQTLHIDITPTYSGCPAMKVIEDEVVKALNHAGIKKVIANRVYAPAWSTDWMSENGKERLRKYGIAPPSISAEQLVTIGAHPLEIACPFCGSKKTSLKSEFGSTACKAMHYCNGCQQPFESFKPI